MIGGLARELGMSEADLMAAASHLKEAHPDLAHQVWAGEMGMDAAFAKAIRRGDKYFGASTKKVGRGISQKTVRLRYSILDAFEELDKPVTVRQMFYRLVSASAIPKSEAQGYRPVQRQLLLMRREKVIPYDWVADNTRWMRKPRTYNGLSDFFKRSTEFYRQSLWADAEAYVEVWLEKDALAGVLYPITATYDVPLMVSRGYSSESFAYEAAENIQEQDKPAFIYYLGDFDPSGWQMAENLEQKLREFGADITFKRLAVTPQQAETLPTRPTKKTDTRHQRFAELFGEDAESVEVDAIHPNKLREIVQEAIEQHIPPGILDAVDLEEEAAKEILQKLQATWREEAR